MLRELQVCRWFWMEKNKLKVFSGCLHTCVTAFSGEFVAGLVRGGESGFLQLEAKERREGWSLVRRGRW